MGNHQETIQVRSAANLVCILLEVHIWSGRRKMDKTDLIRADPAFARLPEKDLASLGAVKICDPEDIKAFQRLKNKAETILERAGLSLLGAWGVPEDKFPGVFAELMALKNEFEQLVLKFSATFEARLTKWREAHLAKNPSWKPMFDNLPNVAKAVAGLSFTFHTYRISAPHADDALVNALFNDEVGGLRGNLLKAVADEANGFIESLMRPNGVGSVVARTYITPKTIGPLRRATARLASFAFMDPVMQPVVAHINTILDRLPAKDKIIGSDLLNLKMIANQLRSAKSLQELIRVCEIGRTNGLDINETETQVSGDVVAGGLDVLDLEQDMSVPVAAAQPATPVATLAGDDSDVYI